MAVHTKSRFYLILWLAAGAVVVYLTLWPLVENAWAYYTWDRVPCVVRDRGDFVFNYGGQRYTATRTDFWVHHQTDSQPTPDLSIDPVFNRTCYVKHNDPTWAVLNLDAPRHLEKNALGFIDAGMIVLVAAAITILRARASRNGRPS